MVLVSHTKKFIYIKNYKVAGTSVELFFEKWCSNKNDIIGFRGNRIERSKKKDIIGSHANIKRILKILGKDVYDKYLKFCVVRNPYDKMVSAYFFLKGQNMFKGTFKEFCQDDNNALNINRYSIDNVPQCDYYIRYENLLEDIKKICLKLNINCKIELQNCKGEYRPKNKHYSEYYDNDTREIVYKKHKKEFIMFGYKFEKNK